MMPASVGCMCEVMFGGRISRTHFLISAEYAMLHCQSREQRYAYPGAFDDRMTLARTETLE